MAVPLDQVLYNQVRREIFQANPKNSAYRSMAIQREYKKRGGRWAGPRPAGGTRRWAEERWLNLTPFGLGLVKKIADCPPCGSRHVRQGRHESVCRPLLRKSAATPRLAKTFSRAQVAAAVALKDAGRRVDWDRL